MKNPTLMNMCDVFIDPVWALRILPRLAHRRQLLPFVEIDGVVLVACRDLKNRTAQRMLEKDFGKEVKFELAEADSLAAKIEEVYGSRSQVLAAGVQAAEESAKVKDELVDLVNRIMDSAILRQASDVHIDPDKAECFVRMRVAGDIEPFESLSLAQHLSLMSRFKVLANLDISEKRSPQDGNMTHTFQGSGVTVDIRVATIPTKHGEKMTLRLLGIRSENLTLESLGMSSQHVDILRQNVDQPHGMILVTGPTGSGKSTTFYAALQEISKNAQRTTITIEDPVEFDLPGINQVQVESGKVTFPSALRSVLRHDPDVILVGEIRDRETAGISVTAAMTGHLVLSTLHTNSAASAVTRLISMGLEPYLLSAVLRLSIAQRLVRQLCANCAEPTVVSADQARLLGDCTFEGAKVYQPKGCKYCANRGFKGRIGLFEFLPVDERFAGIIREGVVDADITAKMQALSIESLWDDGIRKALAGRVPLGEVIRVSGSCSR